MAPSRAARLAFVGLTSIALPGCVFAVHQGGREALEDRVGKLEKRVDDLEKRDPFEGLKVFMGGSKEGRPGRKPPRGRPARPDAPVGPDRPPPPPEAPRR